jgi:hypothetical protein
MNVATGNIPLAMLSACRGLEVMPQRRFSGSDCMNARSEYAWTDIDGDSGFSAYRCITAVVA